MPAAEPRLVGYDADTGKPRMRVQAGYNYFDYGAYRQLTEDMPGEIAWMPLQSGQQDVSQNRDRGLRQARDRERNTELVRGGLDRKSNTVVGPNLYVSPNPDTTWLGMSGKEAIKWRIDFSRAAASAFNEWGQDTRCICDAERHYGFGGLMWQAYRTLVGPDAETLGYIGYDRDRADGLGHKWGTFVHLIDPDRLSTPQNRQMDENATDEDLARRGLPRIVSGRELDRLGAMEALHIAVRHPAEQTSILRHERIPRETEWGRPMAFHWFFKRRAGMQRALTSLISVLRTIRYLDKFSDATLENAVTHAQLATFVKSTMAAEKVAEHLAPQDEFDGKSEFDVKLDAYKKMNLRFGGKRIPVLGPNDEIVFASMDGTAADFDPFRNAFLRELASALGISFEQLSLDFSRASYSSTRSSILESWRQVVFEREMFTRHVASLIYDAVIEEAFALGILEEPAGAPSFEEARGAYTRCNFVGPGMGWVDPLKEIDAAKGRMGSVVSTLRDEASQAGGNWYDNLEQRAVEEMVAEDLGVTIDTGQTPAAAGPDNQAPADQDQADQEQRDAQ